jgi:transformation/transcription domain-associated protein
MRSYEDMIARNVLSLIQACPSEAVSTRKELMVGIRHIIATDFRKGFFHYIDMFLDESVLIGNGRQAVETLRPLAFSTVSDLVQHTKDTMTPAQIVKVISLFIKNLNDYSLPITVQITSVKILVTITEKYNMSTPNYATNVSK